MYGKPLGHSGMNQIKSLNDYTVEVINRFKGQDLIDRVPEEQWMEVRGIVHEAVTKTILKKEQWQEGKMVV